MDMEQQFLQAMASGDAVARLAYADWLEEQGESDLAADVRASGWTPNGLHVLIGHTIDRVLLFDRYNSTNRTSGDVLGNSVLLGSRSGDRFRIDLHQTAGNTPIYQAVTNTLDLQSGRVHGARFALEDYPPGLYRGFALSVPGYQVCFAFSSALPLEEAFTCYRLGTTYHQPRAAVHIHGGYYYLPPSPSRVMEPGTT